MKTLIVCIKCESVNRVDVNVADSKKPICGMCKEALPFASSVQELSAKGLEKLLRNAQQPVIVDFWADWCGPCKAFAPTYKKAAEQMAGRAIFAKLDTQGYPDASQKFGIKGIPTLIIFKEGKEIDRKAGAMNLPMLTAYLEKTI